MKPPPQIFDRKLYALRRARGAGTDFLLRDVAAHLAERIAAINRPFEHALDLSSRDETFEELRHAAQRWTRTSLSPKADHIVADEQTLPLAPESFDLITSVLSLHAVNDLPGALIQIRQALKPGGLFVAALFGGETLRELRHSFARAEIELTGGVSPRVAPFADVRDLGALLQRAGFASPVADVERTVVRYRSFESLLADLRALGETNALLGRSRRPLRRQALNLVLTHYRMTSSEIDARLRATFDIVYLTGWTPRKPQEPLAPASAPAQKS